MTITTSLIVEIGNVGATYDFTDRAMGLRIDQRCDIATFGTGQAVIQLNNDDGALTPTPAGSTYQQLSWFDLGVFISAEITSTGGTQTAELFHGIVTDFELIDDGVNSSVILGCSDLFTIGARSDVLFSSLSFSWAWTHAMIEQSFNGSGSLLPVPMPYLGAINTAIVDCIPSGAVESPVGQFIRLQNQDGITVADLLNNGGLIERMAVAYPTTITLNAAVCTVSAISIDMTLTRRDDTNYGSFGRPIYEFSETPTGTEFPIGDMRRRHNIEGIINAAQVSSGNSSITWDPQLAVDSDSQQQIGVRNTSYQTYALYEFQAEWIATNLVNRFSTLRFEPGEMSVKASQIATYADDSADDQWTSLLDIRTALWCPAVLEYTPTGASTPIVSNTVITARRIEASPADITVSFELLPAADYQSFVLDSDVLGVLNQNRLG